MRLREYLGNYLETENPFGLSAPPDSFLLDLRLYDADAVIFPSTFEAVYRFCRRVKHTPGILTFLRASDTAVCRLHRLVPVCAIYPSPRWGPVLIEDLAAMDTFRLTGADPANAGDKLADLLQRREEDRTAKMDAAMRDELDARSTSAWQALQLREGHTTFMSGQGFSSSPPTPEGSGPALVPAG